MWCSYADTWKHCQTRTPTEFFCWRKPLCFSLARARLLHSTFHALCRSAEERSWSCAYHSGTSTLAGNVYHRLAPWCWCWNLFCRSRERDCFIYTHNCFFYTHDIFISTSEIVKDEQIKCQFYQMYLTQTPPLVDTQCLVPCLHSARWCFPAYICVYSYSCCTASFLKPLCFPVIFGVFHCPPN